ncbi:DUF3224 domain-containing protein [Pseudoteredinibacter isoporae]|uniref:DUF3224 domain-containing protein n=1 Tax=Pseudoteredinibacter isoporae TaxID=570281 RepID=A0A7X0JRA7_9GAMM|nr:DUF3224 domain-containing protein [Pseudoteredinibacter isoporae]MBB6520843.1 hypothetical protein [Pseudoteredinibacter isoporae]NHO86408.1 DUF3224 domain-containing protein [Pseudoteredinibacter isoporae]NIB25140.1 DUF3224 domain-containing protein [Pseudoteredinibacter isoporae]
MALTINAQVQVQQWDEHEYMEGTNIHKQSQADIKQRYSGDLEGSSELRYLMSYPDETQAKFVGFEHVSGDWQGKPFGLVLEHHGEFKNGVASSQFEVLSASGAFAHHLGHGRFAAGKGGSFSFELELEER